MSDETNDDSKTHMIPKARLDEETRTRRSAEAENKRLREELAAAQSAMDGLQRSYQSIRAEHEAFVFKHESSDAMTKAGLTDPGIADYVRHRYTSAKVEEGQQRPPFAEWLEKFKPENAGLFQMGGANGGTLAPAPKGTTAPAGTPPQGPGGTEPGKVAPPDTSGRGVVPRVQPAGGPLTPKEIAALTPEQFAAAFPALVKKPART